MAYRRKTTRTRRGSSYSSRSRGYAGGRRRPVRKARRSYGSARTVRIVIEQPQASVDRLAGLGIGVKAAAPPRKATF